MDGVQLPQGYSHFEEAVYFLPFSSQKFLVHLYFQLNELRFFLSFLSLLLKLLPIKSRRWKSDMKKYFINQFSISCFKKMSETPLDTQVIFKPYLPQVFRMILKIYKRRYQPQNDHMKHHWIHRNVFLFHQRR